MTTERQIYDQNSKLWQFWGLYSHISAPINFGPLPVPNFTLIINDLPDICNNLPDSIKIYVFADDTKVYNTITSDMDQNNLQTVIDKIKE